jgi:environmental stress-induced protein Ves
MKRVHYIFLVFLLLSSYSTTSSSAANRLQRKVLSNFKTKANQQTRAFPADSSLYSIQITGQSNTVKVNGEFMKTTPDTTDRKNKIRVSGEGNTVIVNEDDQKSEVIVTQKGKNNHIIITQKK